MGLAINAAIAPALIIAALLAGAGQGLGQLGRLTLIGLNVPSARRAEANAVLNIGGYIPAGLLPVATGYLIDFIGMAVAATLFAAVLATAAILGGYLCGARMPATRSSDSVPTTHASQSILIYYIL